MLPELTVNRHFMAEFLAAQTPCLALGLVDTAGSPCALVALRPDRVIPSMVSAGGFSFGHSLLGAKAWEVVYFGFRFYEFVSYNALINPNNPIARAVLTTMVKTGDYFFFAIDSNQSTLAFRPEIGMETLAGLQANLSRIQQSATSAAQYRAVVTQFSINPEPPGILLSWVCHDQPDALNLATDRLVLKPK